MGRLANQRGVTDAEVDAFRVEMAGTVGFVRALRKAMQDFFKQPRNH
jgi:hypothetical protein